MKVKKFALSITLVIALIAAICFTGCSSTTTATTAAAPETVAEAAATGETGTIEDIEKAAEAAADAGLIMTEVVPYYSSEDYVVYDVNMMMQAGYPEYEVIESGAMTIHAGKGYLDPFGEGHYFAGLNFPEAAEVPETIYCTPWMDGNWACSLFCIYYTEYGNIYVWDGIYGANAKDLSNYMEGDDALSVPEVNDTDATRGDALINLVFGGTGIFKGAYGVLIGNTSGGGVYGTPGAITLPQTLFKCMEGHIVCPKNCETTSLYTTDKTKFTEATALRNAVKGSYRMVETTLKMQNGATEAGTVIGNMAPFTGAGITAEYGEVPENVNISKYFTEQWLKAYGDPTWITIHVDNGDVAGDLSGFEFKYGTIIDTSNPACSTGDKSAVFTIIIQGTGDFEGCTGILEGENMILNPEGFANVTADGGTPLINTYVQKGWLKVPAEARASEYGNDLIDD